MLNFYFGVVTLLILAPPPHVQVDALGPAVDVLVMDMPTASGEQSLTVLQAAVKVHIFIILSLIAWTGRCGLVDVLHPSHSLSPPPVHSCCHVFIKIILF